MNVPSTPGEELPCPVHAVPTAWAILARPGCMTLGFFDCGLQLVTRWDAECNAAYDATPWPTAGPATIARIVLARWGAHPRRAQKSRHTLASDSVGLQWVYLHRKRNPGWFMVTRSPMAGVIECGERA